MWGNPNGEDSLRVKLNQCQQLLADTPVDWCIYAVDDGCPHNSGQLAQEIADSHPLGNHVQVVHLTDCISIPGTPLHSLQSVDDSQKGGAISAGCEKAINDGVDAVIDTDADSSVHLGQIGLLISQYLNDIPVVLGNRKDPDSVLVKQEERWGIGIKLLRHMQRMIGWSIFSRGILDTQAAFKLYDAKVLNKILENPVVFDFSFDTDWIATVIAEDISFTKVPFAFVDSFAESASIVQGPMSTWEVLLKGLVKTVRARNLPHNEDMAEIISSEILSSKDLDALIDKLPSALNNVSDADLGKTSIMDTTEIMAWIQKCKAE